MSPNFISLQALVLWEQRIIAYIDLCIAFHVINGFEAFTNNLSHITLQPVDPSSGILESDLVTSSVLQKINSLTKVQYV